jgi:hypothetical protein
MRNMGTINASNALWNLWMHSRHSLEKEQLDWFSSLSDFANMEADNIADHLNSLGLLLNGEDKSCHPDAETMATILFSFSYQVKTIAALIEISDEACKLATEKANTIEKTSNKKPD